MGSQISETNKTDRHNITEIMLKVALKHHNRNSPIAILCLNSNCTTITVEI